MELLLTLGKPITSGSIKGSLKYVQGSDPSEKALPSKLEDPSEKRHHGMLFTDTAQTKLRLNVQNAVNVLLFMQRKSIHTEMRCKKV